MAEDVEEAEDEAVAEVSVDGSACEGCCCGAGLVAGAVMWAAEPSMEREAPASTAGEHHAGSS